MTSCESASRVSKVHAVLPRLTSSPHFQLVYQCLSLLLSAYGLVRWRAASLNHWSQQYALFPAALRSQQVVQLLTVMSVDYLVRWRSAGPHFGSQRYALFSPLPHPQPVSPFLPFMQHVDLEFQSPQPPLLQKLPQSSVALIIVSPFSCLTVSPFSGIASSLIVCPFHPTVTGICSLLPPHHFSLSSRGHWHLPLLPSLTMSPFHPLFPPPPPHPSNCSPFSPFNEQRSQGSMAVTSTFPSFPSSSDQFSSVFD